MPHTVVSPYKVFTLNITVAICGHLSFFEKSFSIIQNKGTHTSISIFMVHGCTLNFI